MENLRSLRRRIACLQHPDVSLLEESGTHKEAEHLLQMVAKRLLYIGELLKVANALGFVVEPGEVSNRLIDYDSETPLEDQMEAIIGANLKPIRDSIHRLNVLRPQVRLNFGILSQRFDFSWIETLQGGP
jgi:hypothetical protein